MNPVAIVLRMAWSAAPSGGYFYPRRTNSESYSDGISAYYPYPGDASNGFIAYVGASARYASYSSSPLNTSPNLSGTFSATSGYYDNTAGYNFFEYNGKRYIAYAKNNPDDRGDGRFYILEGESTTAWADILGSSRKVIYQAAIHEDLAYTDGDYHAELGSNPSPKKSGNSALDCTVRLINGEPYIAVLKQNVGLSLFKMSLK